ncbi:MAG: hypothetical protein COA63_007715 [Methylophaga sp.]|nr:hypothetical protein [Methylophaga sp.]
MSGDKNKNFPARLVLVVGIFDGENRATSAVEKLIEEDFPADRISLLHKASGPGDDMLGLSYSSTEERVKVWGKHGLFWGGLWGLLTGISGLFVLPGMGAVFAAGPIVEALGITIAGATLGGGAMAGAAVVTELASALHEMGIPKEELATIHDSIEQGHYIVILHCARDQVEQYERHIKWAGADPVMTLPILI